MTAVCVPDGNHVRVDTARRCPIRCLYVDARLDAVGNDLRVINLAPLTRELVTHAVAIAPLTLEDAADRALLTLLTERLAAEPDTPLHLPLPSDAAAADVATAIMAEPAWPLDRCLSAAGASRRTVERRFKSETLMSLGQWRRRARVLEAVAMLARGKSVTSTANAVGYASPSSFVFAFRAELGSSPRTFMDSSGSVGGPARRESR